MLTFPTILPTERVVFHIAEKVEGEYETEIIFHDFTVDRCVVAPTSAAELPEGFNLLERETITVHIPDSLRIPLAVGSRCGGTRMRCSQAPLLSLNPRSYSAGMLWG